MKKIFLVFFILIVSLFNFQSCQNGSEYINQTSLTHPDWSYDATIYEVNIRQYTPEGTFAAFEKHLQRLKEMGVDILWLMPIHPIGLKNRKGNLGSYYSVRDYKKVNPDFGSSEDFKHLIRSAHNLGLKLIIDWVANHTAWDNVWVKTHPEYYTKDEDGNFTPPAGTDWSDVIDLNYNNKDLWAAMTDALEYWVKEYDVDGFRCDVAAMVPIEFWNQARAKLDKIKPVFMLAEASEPELQEKAFDMTYNWRLKDEMNLLAKGESNLNNLRALFRTESEKYKPDYFRMVFTGNHDENSWHGTVYERLGDGAEAFAVLTMTAPGMPLVYSGQEAGLNKRLAFFDKDLITWNKNPLEQTYKKFLNLKKRNKALRNGAKGGAIKFIENNDEDKIFSFYREKEGDKLLAFFNFSGEPANLIARDSILTGKFKDVNSGNFITLTGSYSAGMPPWSFIALSAE